MLTLSLQGAANAASLEVVANLATTSIEVFATLQRLGLAPPWPLLPNPIKLSWSSLSPILIPSTPPSWTLLSSFTFLMGIVLSPLSLMLVMNYFSTYLENRVGRYARMALPKPDCPDEYSKKGNEEDDNPAFLSLESGSFRAEIKKDFLAVFDSVTYLTTMLEPGRLSEACARVLDVGSGVSRARQRTQNPRTHSTSPQQPSLLSQASLHGPTLVQNASAGTGSTDPNASISARESASTRTPSPLPSVSSDLDETMQRMLDENNMVHVTTRSASTDTLHMNVEVFNRPVPGAPVFTSSFSASPRPTVEETIEVEQIDGMSFWFNHGISKLTVVRNTPQSHCLDNARLYIDGPSYHQRHRQHPPSSSRGICPSNNST